MSVMRLKISTLERITSSPPSFSKPRPILTARLVLLVGFASRARREHRTLRDLVAGSKARMPNDLRAELPYLLWLYHMGIILFWIHDGSFRHVRTYRLIDTQLIYWTV